MLVNQDSIVSCWADGGGLTPLHRAAFITNVNFVNLRVIKKILKCCPESAMEVDKNSGKTILHFLINRVYSYQQGKQLMQIPQIGPLKDVKDLQENTPSDLAQKSNFKMAQLLSVYPLQHLTFNN
uniref:Uncharacterized protein n=1 Tax=Chenopodium quinoa TaxID=63459 RepID=A0A803LAC4_CHEQI